MALSLSSLVTKTNEKPPLMVTYGRGKMGKTTRASEFPNAIFIQTEDGAGDIEVTTFADEPLGSFDLVMRLWSRSPVKSTTSKRLSSTA